LPSSISFMSIDIATTLLNFCILDAYIWLRDIRYSWCWYVFESDLIGPLLTYNGKEMDSPLQKWLPGVLKRMLGVRGITPSWCVMCECGLEPLQFNWFCVAMRLYNS
jgi:hypothetical protein